MRVFPSIDVRGGACVQWVGGEPDAEKIRLPDPVEVAHRWKAAGFKVLHEGEDVVFDIIASEKGPKAENVQRARPS